MEINYAYAETLDVLENMNNIHMSKIPKSFIEFLKVNSSKDYKKHVLKCISLSEQPLERETLAILAMINKKYWTNNPVKVKPGSIELKYFKEDIFEKEQDEIEEKQAEKTTMIEYKKETFFKKLVNKIKNLFRKK